MDELRWHFGCTNVLGHRIFQNDMDGSESYLYEDIPVYQDKKGSFFCKMTRVWKVQVKVTARSTDYLEKLWTDFHEMCVQIYITLRNISFEGQRQRLRSLYGQ